MPATEKDLSNDFLFFEGYASLGGERMGSKPKKGKSTVENKTAQPFGLQLKQNILYQQSFQVNLVLGLKFKAN